MNYYLTRDEVYQAVCTKLERKLSKLEWQFVKLLLITPYSPCYLEDEDIDNEMTKIKKMIQLVNKHTGG